MNQIGLLPAGCQVQGKTILFANSSKLYYASTLSIYIFCAETFSLEKVVAVSERSLCSFTVSPFDFNIIACVSVDGCLSLWKLDEDSLLNRVHTQMQNRTNLVMWDPHSPGVCALVSSDPHIRILTWTFAKGTAGLTELFAIKKQGLSMSCIQWNPHTAGLLASGCSNSWVFIFNTKDKTQTSLHVRDRTQPVVDLKWDRLSSVYLLVAYQSFLSLWDTESGAELHIFDSQSTNISSIAWMDWTAGNFVTSNIKTGSLRVWNASQRQPLETIKVSTVGITSIFLCSETKTVLSSCVDGSVAVFNLSSRMLEFGTCAGHTDTIFDCAFRTSSADMFATASYDGTVKLWNLSSLTLHKTMFVGNVILYGLSWSVDGLLLAVCTAKGEVAIFEALSGKEVFRVQHHSKSVYSVNWNRRLSETLCSTSADGTLIVIDVPVQSLLEASGSLATGSKAASDAGDSEGNAIMRMRFTHPGPVFGSAWCPHNCHFLATGCQDGLVRVFDFTLNFPLLYELNAHTARSFNVAWSSLSMGMLASGSDDRTICVWKIDLGVPAFDAEPSTISTMRPICQLIGHKVRSFLTKLFMFDPLFICVYVGQCPRSHLLH